MKNNLKKLLSVFLCAVLLFTTASTAFAAEETRTVVDSGYCGAEGENLTWTLYSDGELVISGEGEMDFFVPNPDKSERWHKYYDRIDVITVEEGVTSISYNAFNSYDLTKYYKINLPKSLKFIEGNLFTDAGRVPGQHLAYCYAGSKSDFRKIERKHCTFEHIDSEIVIEYIGTDWLIEPELKYGKVYYNGEEPSAFCELVEDKELGYDFVAHYYSPDPKADKLLWYHVINDKDKKVAQMNVGEYKVKEFYLNTNKSGQHYLRVDVVDGDGNVIVSSDKVLIAEVPGLGERVDNFFSGMKLLYAEVVYVLWLFIGLPIFGAVALPVLEILNLFGYEI